MFAWTETNAEMKDMTCRVALLRMQADGLITLPPSQTRSAKVKPHFPPTPATDPQASVLQPVHELGSLTLHLVTGTAPSRLWNEYIARYQYLGYTPMYLRGKTPLKPYSMFCTCSMKSGCRPHQCWFSRIAMADWYTPGYTEIGG